MYVLASVRDAVHYEKRDKVGQGNFSFAKILKTSVVATASLKTCNRFAGLVSENLICLNSSLFRLGVDLSLDNQMLAGWKSKSKTILSLLYLLFFHVLPSLPLTLIFSSPVYPSTWTGVLPSPHASKLKNS